MKRGGPIDMDRVRIPLEQLRGESPELFVPSPEHNVTYTVEAKDDQGQWGLVCQGASAKDVWADGTWFTDDDWANAINDAANMAKGIKKPPCSVCGEKDMPLKSGRCGQCAIDGWLQDMLSIPDIDLDGPEDCCGNDKPHVPGGINCRKDI